MIRNYDDFMTELCAAGFSGAIGGKDDGVFGLFRYGWGAEDESSIHWHTGDPETDPWEWRMRVLNERNDIAYSKIFFRKAGYITKEWYPYFLSARRGGKSFEEMYADGICSNYAKRIYELLRENESLPLHEIKLLGGFDKKENSKFDKALTDLQMGLFITMSGMQQKVSRIGIEYGWFSTVFCTTERFWGNDVFEKASGIRTKEAEEKITERILKLNPSADEKKIVKFIRG
jgi:hypothetical protein